MSSVAAADTYITPEAYLASERKAQFKNEYILVSQNRIHVEHYRLMETQWVQKAFHAPEDVLVLNSIDCKLPLQDIYTRVTFPD